MEFFNNLLGLLIKYSERKDPASENRSLNELRQDVGKVGSVLDLVKNLCMHAVSRAQLRNKAH